MLVRSLQALRVEFYSNNIQSVTPSDLLDYLHDTYDDCFSCKGSALTSSDLATMQGILGWCANVQAYLNPLICKMDIVCRSYPVSKAPDCDYQLALSKKTILTQYYKNIDNISKTVSRQCSLYQDQLQEMRYEQRADNIGRIAG